MADDTACTFPSCTEPRELGDLPFCAEHRTLLLDDPGEFRRQWGALDPRPGAERSYLPRRMGGTATDADADTD
jgi:hypothetical protein